MSDRSVLACSWLTTSVLGCLFVIGYWSSQGELGRGLFRSVGLVGIMGGVHSVGYRAYRRQGLSGNPADDRPDCPTPGIAPAYLDGFKLALVEQVLLLGLSSLMLDGGRLFRVCGVAALAFAAVSALIVVRRPVAPTSFDLIVVRYGSLILPPIVGLAASLA